MISGTGGHPCLGPAPRRAEAGDAAAEPMRRDVVRQKKKRRCRLLDTQSQDSLYLIDYLLSSIGRIPCACHSFVVHARGPSLVRGACLVAGSSESTATLENFTTTRPKCKLSLLPHTCSCKQSTSARQQPYESAALVARMATSQLDPTAGQSAPQSNDASPAAGTINEPTVAPATTTEASQVGPGPGNDVSNGAKGAGHKVDGSSDQKQKTLGRNAYL